MRLGVDFSDRIVTVTATAGSAAVLTLPAPSDARIFISRLEIFRFAADDLVAAATPVIITQTGLPGSVAWSVPANLMLQGVATVQLWEPRMAIAGSQRNLAVVVTAPATTNVIWRLTAHYVHSYYSKH